ncbi:MAG: FG-GAP repeat protein, partial [Candidatus Omnitrophica bacterium]|nr:FG-GAP repeat protein [Candidatus Omnitrophota bacterium]
NPQILTISISSETAYRAGQVAPAGDLNGDGFADLLIGNQWADGDYLHEGKAYIFYGSASGISNSADVIIDNPNPEYNVRFGKSIDSIGDFNHDGFDDIVVGCPYGSYASIYYGSPEGVSSEPSLILSGINWLGWSVSRVGDIKGNGQNFIVVGEEFGTAYLYALAKTYINIDIIPKTCPNEFSIKGGGSMKVAILGSVDFDVNNIDIESVRLEGIAPVRSSFKDKSSPVVPPPTECECTTEGRDGFLDLCLKFDKKAILSALSKVNVGDNFVLTLTGSLNDGTPIEGQDCIVIVKKGKKD